VSVCLVECKLSDIVVIAIVVLTQGFVSFAVTDVHMSVINVGVTRTCSGKTCRGLYGVAGCPCVTTTHGPCNALSILASFGHKTPDGNFVDQFKELGLRLEPYISTQFTQQLVDPQFLEVSLCSR